MRLKSKQWSVVIPWITLGVIQCSLGTSLWLHCICLLASRLSTPILLALLKAFPSVTATTLPPHTFGNYQVGIHSYDCFIMIVPFSVAAPRVAMDTFSPLTDCLKAPELPSLDVVDELNAHFLSYFIFFYYFGEMDLIPKWRPMTDSFVCMLLRPLCLVIMYKKQKNFEVKMRLRGLKNSQTEESMIMY